MTLPERVRIVETSPRDGLQNESGTLTTPEKVQLITGLAAAGLKEIEASSFVHPRVIPQLADADELFAGLPPETKKRCSALIPNERGLDRALAAGVPRIAFLTGVSATFLSKNIGLNPAESLQLLTGLVKRALAEGLQVRVDISTAFVCPFEGKIPVARVVEMAARLREIGAEELCLCDTLGAAVPTDIEAVLPSILVDWPAEKVALHLHDSSGTALANALTGLQMGITCFDSAAGGLGSCPFAPGSSGNLATEDLVYMLEGMGIGTGIDLEALLDVAETVCAKLGKSPGSRVWRRLRGG